MKVPSGLLRFGLPQVVWLANILFSLVLGLALWQSHQQHVRYAEERATNTTLTLERSLSGILDRIDLTLAAVAAELEQEILENAPPSQRVNQRIERLMRNSPDLAILRYSDAAGRVSANSGYPANSPAVDYGDREYFQWLRDHPEAGMISAKPLIGRTSGKHVVPFARRYNDGKGNFAGVVVTSVEVARFSALFAALHLGERAGVAMIDTDLVRLALHPHMPALIGQPSRDEALKALVNSGSRFFTIRIDGKAADGVERIYAVRRLDARPYLTGVGLSIEDELAPWRRQAALAFGVMLIFAALTGFAGWQLQRGWRRQEEAHAVLESTLEAADEGILVVGEREQVLHSNAQFAAMWRIPEDLQTRGDDKALLKHVSDQLTDPQAFIRNVEALYAQPERESFDTIEFADGRAFERTSAPMRIGGKPAGRVWCFRDVSENRQIEAMLKFIAQRGWVESGQGFLPALAERLGKLLGVDYVLINKLGDAPEMAETVGLYAHGAVMPNLSYSLTGTPCENVIGKEMCIYRESIQQLFPEDGLLVDMKAESYMGVPLWDSLGHPIGLIALLDGWPLKNVDQAQALLQLVAASAGAELERQREEKTLRRERDRAQGYLDTVEAMIVVLDRQGQIVLINRHGCELLGWNEADLLGRSWFESCLPQPEGRQQVLPHFLKIIAGELEAAEYFENEIFTRTGERRLMAWHNAILRDEQGEIAGTLSAGEDITERRLRDAELDRHRHQLESLVEERTHALSAALHQAEAANRAKSVFLSNMSHELRTPLNAVIGFSRLMTRSATLSVAEKNNLEIINRSGNHLLTLINDVLELSKIEAGHVSVQEEDCDIGGLAHDVVEMLRNRAEQDGLRLDLNIDGVPARLRTDTTKLRQILINLLGNAIKFTPTGSVGLSLQGRPADGGALRLDFAVSDTGIGIAAEDQPHIFEPFVQMVTHATTAGTGLGLSITRQYLAMLGGTLSLESVPGQGSTFRFSLTLPVANTPAALSPITGAAPGQEGMAQRIRILIAEDNLDSRQLLKQILIPLGLSIAEAADGVEAVVLAAIFQPNLILMDWRMPNMDGLAATQQIRAQAAGHPVKILMLSANVFEEQKQQALDAGVDDFLRKPVQENELYAALEAQLGCTLPHPAPMDPGVASQDKPNLGVAEFAALPSELFDALRTAVEEMNPAKIKAVLALIEPNHPQLARSIGVMTDAFQYQELWALLSERTQESPGNTG